MCYCQLWKRPLLASIRAKVRPASRVILYATPQSPCRYSTIASNESVTFCTYTLHVSYFFLQCFHHKLRLGTDSRPLPQRAKCYDRFPASRGERPIKTMHNGSTCTNSKAGSKEYKYILLITHLPIISATGKHTKAIALYAVEAHLVLDDSIHDPIVRLDVVIEATQPTLLNLR